MGILAIVLPSSTEGIGKINETHFQKAHFANKESFSKTL